MIGFKSNFVVLVFFSVPKRGRWGIPTVQNNRSGKKTPGPGRALDRDWTEMIAVSCGVRVALWLVATRAWSVKSVSGYLVLPRTQDSLRRSVVFS